MIKTYLFQAFLLVSSYAILLLGKLLAGRQ